VQQSLQALRPAAGLPAQHLGAHEADVSCDTPQAEIVIDASSGAHHDAVEATAEEAEARREVEGVCSGPLRGHMFSVLEAVCKGTDSELDARKLHLRYAGVVCLGAPCSMQLMLCQLRWVVLHKHPLPSTGMTI